MRFARLLLSRAFVTRNVNLRYSTGEKGGRYLLPYGNEPEDYRAMVQSLESTRNERLTSSKRFQRISEGEDRSDWPSLATGSRYLGRHLLRYRGLILLKCAEDLVTYHQLFDLVRPKTIIELGTFSGSMTIWMADTMKLLDASCHIYSMDLDSSNRSEETDKLKPDNVTFLQGDSYAIDKVFPKEFLSKMPHPWVVIEDAHANLHGVLRYFHQHCHEGDYMTIEDTSPEMPTEHRIDSAISEFEAQGPMLLQYVRDFLEEHEDYWAVDSFLSDLFGHNSTWHWHGFIRKMK